MHLILGVKDSLQDMRDNGWEPLFKKVKTFCEKNEIEVPDMDKEINARGTSARRRQKVTNMHFYHVEVFLAAVDAILSEMNHRFGEVSSELLGCMASLSPKNSFSNFDVDKLVRLAEIYVEDFNVANLLLLPGQLKDFITRVKRNSNFLGCTKLPKVAEIMVKTGMNKSYPLVYKLIELTLILPVAICYIEKEIFRSISNGKIIQHFEEMKKCRMLVPRVCSIRFNISFYFELLICQLSPIYYVGIQNAPREDPQSS